MSIRPSNAAIALVVVLAGILLTTLVPQGPFRDLGSAEAASASYSYAENGTAAVATFTATDPDGDAIVWSLDGTDADDFTLVSGVLSFKNSPDYENPSSKATGTLAERNVYKVTVKASDSSLDVTVTVTNVDEAGVASLDQFQLQVGRTVMASITDQDKGVTGETWQWARGSSKAGTFVNIQDATSHSRAPVTDDVGHYLRATVTYTDSFGSGKTAMVVSDRAVEASPLANAAPTFDDQDDDDNTPGTQVTRSVDENTAVGSAVGKPVSATDPDGDVLIYTIVPDQPNTDTTDDEQFDIDRATGQLKVKVKFNFEAAEPGDDDNCNGNDDICEVTVKATDPSGASDTQSVTINIANVNEAPAFGIAAPKSTVTIAEDTIQLLQPNAAGTDTESLAADAFEANDEDTVDSVASYDLEGADAKYFEIGETSGALSLKADQDNDGTNDYSPNYEKQSSYSITIAATGGTGDRRLTGRLDVTIKVTNAEDTGSVTLSQIEPQEGRPVVATLSDEDGSETISKWVWEYVALGNDQVCNPGENQTGPSGTWATIPNATSAAYTPKDFTDSDNNTIDIANKCLRATATYTDGFVTPDNPDTGTVNESIDTATEETDAVVQIRSTTNSAPKFGDQDLTTPGDQSDSTSRSVAENTDAGQPIGSPVTADDTDGDLRLYTLGGADKASFDIDRRTGQIKTKAALDYETKKVYMATVTATDPSGASDSIAVTVNVTDVNDPVDIVGEKSVTYAENGTAAVATFTASDQDGDAIVWSLAGTDDDFTLAGGVLSFKKSPDYEMPSSAITAGTLAERNVYKVTVKATDGSLEVTVTVTNVDEAGVASLDQFQLQAGRAVVATLADEDRGLDEQKWQWARGSSKTGTFVDIQDATNASRAPVADDVGRYLRATVTYTDSFGSGKTAMVVSDRAVEASPLANAAPSFKGQDETGPTVDDDTGQDGVQDNIVVNREVDENTAVGSAVGKPVSATDPDGDVLIYTIVADPSDAPATTDDEQFDIDTATGQLKVKTKFDAEASDGADDNCNTANTCKVNVKATDPSGADMDQEVTIKINNLNEAPKFATTAPTATVTVTERATQLLQPNAAGTDTVNLAADAFEATDEDTADTAVSYAVEGADAKYFAFVNPSSPVLTIDADQDNDGTNDYLPNYEKQSSYSITIAATGGIGDRRVTGRLDVTIKVTNAEDTGSVTLSQIEPQVGRPVVATLSDEDGSENISTWAWHYAPLEGSEVCNPGDGESGPDSDDWVAIPNATSASYTPNDFIVSGTTTVIANNCLRATASYKDGFGTNTDTAVEETDAVVQIRSATNSAPKFGDQDLTTPGDQSDSTSRSVAENTPAGQSVGSAVSASDGDGELMLYTLGGADNASFGINRRTGQIETKAALDYETKKVYMVTVTATDPSGASDSIAVTINVTDVNDPATIIAPGTGGGNNAPTFGASSASRSVAENTAAGTAIGAPVMATDADGDSLTYSVSGADASSFTIGASTGQLMTSAALDYETKSSYTVTVAASDGTASATISVTISVTDADEAGFDLNGNGTIERNEVITAIGSYLGGTGGVQRSDVIGLIGRYLSGS